MDYLQVSDINYCVILLVFLCHSTSSLSFDIKCAAFSQPKLASRTSGVMYLASAHKMIYSSSGDSGDEGLAQAFLKEYSNSCF